MESAILGVILDSSIVIEAERQHLNVAQFLKQIVQKIGEMGSRPLFDHGCRISVWDLPRGHS